jgi:hypothetical protein
MVLVLALSLGAAALVASTGPPTAMCLSYGGGGAKLILAVKKTGTVKLLDGSMKFYLVQGELVGGPTNSGPLVGTGHVKMVSGLPWFHFSLSGTFYNASNELMTWMAEGKLNLTAGTGTLRRRVIFDFLEVDELYDLQAVDCAGETVPY